MSEISLRELSIETGVDEETLLERIDETFPTDNWWESWDGLERSPIPAITPDGPGVPPAYIGGITDMAQFIEFIRDPDAYADRENEKVEPAPQPKQPKSQPLWKQGTGGYVNHANRLGIRTRTYARLKAQGISDEKIHEAIRPAINQNQHVSRDEAIKQYFDI